MNRVYGVAFICFIVAVWGCKKSSSKYEEVRQYLQKSIAIQKEYLHAIEQAKNQKDVALAMNSFAEKLKEINPIMRNLVEKYPEIVSEKDIPKELQDVMEEQNSLAAKIHEASMKNVVPYINTPEVIEATKNLANVMGEH